MSPSTPAAAARASLAQSLVRLSGITKRFGSTLALDAVDLDLRAGEVIALMGANGAGKSTLVRILSGVYPPDAGTIVINGATVAPTSPKAAKALGVVTVHQAIAEVGVPTLTVAENLVLDDLCAAKTGALASRKQIRARAATIAAGIGLDLDINQTLDRLTIAEQQLVAIARAVASNPAVMIFDEPTASLSKDEVDRLFAVIDRLRERGAAILYISHRLADLRRIADRVAVLRDGKMVGAFEQPIDLTAAVQAMIGRGIGRAAQHTPIERGAPQLVLSRIKLRENTEPFDLTVRRGEVVAITGAVGAGKSSLAEIIFGVRPPAGGTMTVAGRSWAPRAPGQSIKGGVFLAGEDRWRTSLFPATVPFASIAGTISFPFLRGWYPAGPVGTAREREAAEHGIRAFGVKCRDHRDRLNALSGGNQQKVVVARWHAEPAQVLLLDEPFQGVDIGAREDIVRAIRAGAAERATLVFVSDHEEALEVGDRIVVMHDHKIIEDQDREAIDLAQILTAAAQIGTKRPEAET
ncbi:MAG TPA: sugar ABC transporter ATP-binding protein [Magnetospirillaceae bacterium]